MKNCRFVLIVDDDPANITRMQLALAPLELTPLTANNGQEALAVMWQNVGPDGFAGIVITDLKMPVMDGLEFLGRARKEDAELPVILISAYGEIASAVEAMKSGAFDFLERPIVLEDLRSRVTRAIATRNQVLENRNARSELTKRRLAAIMVADIVGYSRLMEEDEVGTFLAFRVRRETTIEPVFNNHGGRVVKLMGDSVLVEFSSAVNAVQAAIELQKRMAIDNAPIPESRHLILRIGINLGDVIGEGSDIYGEGVNIAARLEPLADPGGIVISDKVEAEVRGKLTAAFTDIGEQQLKNIARPVRAYSLGDSGLPRPRASWFRFL
jgi:class 3 adenylate cyclase